MVTSWAVSFRTIKGNTAFSIYPHKMLQKNGKFDKLLCTPSAVLRCYLLSRFPEIDISGNEKGNLVRLQPWIVNGAKKNKYIRAYYSHNWQNIFSAIPCLSASMFYHWVTAFPSPYSRQAQRTCFMLRFSFTAERECTYLYLPLDYTHRNSSQITGKKGSGAFSFLSDPSPIIGNACQ